MARNLLLWLLRKGKAMSNPHEKMGVVSGISGEEGVRVDEDRILEELDEIILEELDGADSLRQPSDEDEQTATLRMYVLTPE